MGRKFDFSNTFVAVAPGASDIYKVEIVSTEQTQTQKGSDRVRFQAKVLEGCRTGTDHASCAIRDGFNLPFSGDSDMDAMMAEMWMKFFLSVGFTHEQVQSGEWDFDKVGVPKATEYLVGRTGYVKYLPADPDNGRKWAKTTWLTESQYGAASSAQSEVRAATATSDASDPLAKMLSGK